MSKVLELYDSRVSNISWQDDAAIVHFSVGYIYDAKGVPGASPASEWSQEVNIVLEEAKVLGSMPSLPNAAIGGYLQLGKVHHDMIPVPLHSKHHARLYLQFSDYSELEMVGEAIHVELLGEAILLEGFT